MLPWEVTQVLAPERESPVALNMVIAQDTEYVLLDEPTNDLDIHHAANLMKTVRRLCDELSKTVILVLHEIQRRPPSTPTTSALFRTAGSPSSALWRR